MCDAVRFLPPAALAAACSAVAAQDVRPTAPPAFELTPFIGYRTAGELERSGTGEEVDVDAARSLALAFNLRVDEGSQYELFYSRQDSELERGTSLGGLDVNIEYFQIGGTLRVDDRLRYTPYIVGTLGATRFKPDAAGARDKTKFSISIGGGARVPFSERFSLRFEARGFLTFVDTDSSLFCTSDALGGACEVRASGSTFIQYEVLVGPAFAF